MTAHPDDVDFGSAGHRRRVHRGRPRRDLLHRHERRGGGSDRAMSRAEMAALRQDEQRAAAATVGVERRALPRPPRRQGRRRPSSCAATSAASSARCGPSASSPSRPSATGTSSTPAIPTTWRPARRRSYAVYPDARNPFAHPELLEAEGLEPWTVPELWIMGPAGSGPASPSTRRPRWSARSPRSCATRARCSTPTARRSGSAPGARPGRDGRAAGGRPAEMFRVIRIP